MLVSSCSSRELGNETLRSHMISPCKFHFHSAYSFPESTLIFPSGLNNIIHCQNRPNPQSPFACTSVISKNFDKVVSLHIPRRGIRVFKGFKLQGHSKIVPLVSKVSSFNGKKKRYGGVLPSILRSLESEDDDLEKVLSSTCENLTPKEQTVILKEQSSCDRLIKVWEFFKSQKDYVPNVIHYNIVLRALGRAQRWDDLRLCWIDMAKNGVVPTNNTYGMLVDVYAKAGLVKEALLWIKHMKARGVFPDEITMNTVVRVLRDVGEYNRADKFYKDWCNGKVELDDLQLDTSDLKYGFDSTPISYKNFLSTELFRTGCRVKKLDSSDIEVSIRKPRLTSTYNTLIDLYGKAGRLNDAAGIFAEMLRSGVAMDTITFNTMIFTCGSHGHLAEAEVLMNEMEARGIPPDTKTYNIFLSLYAESGNIDAALDCYKKIRKAGLFPDVVTHRAVIHILCTRKMIKEVEDVIEDMRKYGSCVEEHSLPAVVKMYVDEGLLSQAKFFLESFQKDHEISSKIRAALMDAYAEKGFWAEAECLFHEKRSPVLQKKDVLEYNVMIKAYGKAKLYDKAFSLFKGMKKQGTWPDECTYNSLIQMFAGGDLMEEATDLLDEMQRVGFKPQCLTFSTIIASYARQGQLSEAANIYLEMDRLGVKPNEVVYGSLINGFAEIGRADEALHYFRRMEERGIQANKIILTSLIKVYSKLGFVDGAKTVYEKMKSMQGGLDMVASNSMMNLYADLGMISEAILIFENLKQNGLADGVSFATIMQLYKSMGMFNEAIEVAEEMKSAGLLRDCSSYNEVMACYTTSGFLRDTGELLHEMVTRKLLPDNGTFRVLFTVLKKGGLPIEAVTQLESSYHDGKPYARQAIISLVYCVVGLHTLAIDSCEVFSKAKMALDSSVYNVCIYIYGVLGEVDRALNVYMKMLDEGYKPDVVTYVHLVGCYGKAGMIEGVKRIYSHLKYGDVVPNENLFRAIVQAYKINNRHDLAELVNKEMKFSLDSQQNSDSETEDELETSLEI